MPDVQKVSVGLTGGQLVALKAAVEAGDYATTSEIVREAIRDWQFKRETRQEEVKRLRRLWDDGKASGPAEPFDVQWTLAAAQARLREASITPRGNLPPLPLAGEGWGEGLAAAVIP